MPKLLSCPLFMLTLLAAFPVAAEETTPQFQTRLAIETPEQAAYYRLTLPLQVYEASRRDDLGDLRILNADGQAVPLARLGSATTTENHLQHLPLKWFPLKAAPAKDQREGLHVVVRQADNGTLVSLEGHTPGKGQTSENEQLRGYVLDASQIRNRDRIIGLDLDWGTHGAQFQLLDVESSDDLQHWSVVQQNVQLANLDYNGTRINNRHIELHGLPGRYVRLLWRDPVQAPVLAQAQITVDDSRILPPALVWSEPLAASPGTKPEGVREYHYHLPRPLPVNRISIELPAGNQLLPVRLLRLSKTGQTRITLATSVVYRIQDQNREWQYSEIPLGNPLLQDILLQTDTRMAALPAAPAIRYAVQPDQLVFLASGRPPFALVTGNPEVRDAALPITTLVPGYGQEGGPRIAAALIKTDTLSSLGLETPAVSPDKTSSKKYLLWGILILGVLAMAGMAWQLIRQMKQP